MDITFRTFGMLRGGRGLILALVAWSTAAAAQQQQPVPANSPAFDAASVKPSKPNIRGYSIQPLPGRLTTTNTTLRMLIAVAWRVYDVQVSGGPKWLDSDRYDIEAKAEGTSRPSNAELMEMLQKLLVDRFSLEFHREKKEIPAYSLEVGKGGPKFQESKQDGGPPVFRVFQRRQITAQRAPLAWLVDALSPLLGRPVLDKTGLAAVYDFKLEWTPDETQVRSDETAQQPDDRVPSLSAALQEQLGLRLQSQKGPVEILVIDRAAKPSGN
jgi:uncharacterized protein (TIGR03435 family)